MLIGLLLVEALPSLVSDRHFVFFLVLFLCCFVSVLTNKVIHSFIHIVIRPTSCHCCLSLFIIMCLSERRILVLLLLFTKTVYNVIAL